MGVKGALLVGFCLFIPGDSGWSEGRGVLFFSKAILNVEIHWAMLVVFPESRTEQHRAGIRSPPSIQELIQEFLHLIDC